ncbi:MAG: nucleoside-diphosphate-sugar epimerase [Acidimicrobiales bacterium]|jgi:nucleoside-diphosphate-sugar epimerase
MEQKIIFLVGVGYVGEMLCHQLGKRDDVKEIIALDKEPQGEWCASLPKVTYIQHNMADDGWQDVVSAHAPDAVIHTAWQIRAMYGEAKEQWRWNVDGSDKVFEFAFTQPSVKKLVYFSTASSYSARKDNRFEHLFTEEEGFRDDDYIYAHEKKVTEDNLQAMYNTIKSDGGTLPQVSIVRPAAVTGPRGRYMRIRFGLQSALSGNLKGGFINRVITTLTSFVPATKGWVRQFIHEDDVSDIVTKFVLEEMDWDYNVFNITPVSDAVYAKDMAQAVGKKILPITPTMARLAFSFFWHTTRGRIPTCPGSWRFYSYPVLLSGEKLRKVYECKHTSKDAFQYTDGRYEEWVPDEHRRSESESKV